MGSGIGTCGLSGGWNKKGQGVNLSGNMHFSGYYSGSEGSITRAQRLGEIMGEGD